MELFASADLPVLRTSSVNYRARIDDPRVSEVRILRPQEIPTYLEQGIFDLGISGRDWVEENSADVVSMAHLKYSKVTGRPVRLVVAVGEDSDIRDPSDFSSGVRVSTEYLNIARRYFGKLGVEANISLSYGATEAKIPDIVDCVLELTETGGALRAARLRIVDTVMVSHTELLANPAAHADEEKRRAMEQISVLLGGTLEARDNVLVKTNVSPEALSTVIDLLPCLKAPTVNELYEGRGFAVEAVVPKLVINTLIPELLNAGATDILELPLSKIVH